MNLWLNLSKQNLLSKQNDMFEGRLCIYLFPHNNWAHPGLWLDVAFRPGPSLQVNGLLHTIKFGKNLLQNLQ